MASSNFVADASGDCNGLDDRMGVALMLARFGLVKGLAMRRKNDSKVERK